MSGKEAYKIFNTLTGLVRTLEGAYTTVDLRDDSSVTGLITSCDANMNITMENALFIDVKGTESIFDNFFVRKRNIRYVHIPKGYSAVELLQGLVRKSTKSVTLDKERKKLTFKKSRAQKKQLETILDNYRENEESEDSDD